MRLVNLGLEFIPLFPRSSSGKLYMGSKSIRVLKTAIRLLQHVIAFALCRFLSGFEDLVGLVDKSFCKEHG